MTTGRQRAVEDTTVRDARLDATPLDWARHLGHPALAELLAQGD